ncbi:hypothetical protein LCGC14_3065590, partial [marine sediment metagenome]
MKIVLLRPNYQSHIITPPLGLGYLAAYLNQNSVEAKIIDGLAADLSPDALVQKAIAEKPDAVGITCLTAFYEQTVTISRLLKERGARVIIGGVHPTFMPYETLKDSGADFLIRGEGEIALLELAQNNFAKDGISGVYSQDDIECNEQQPCEKAERFEDLDKLPFPDWSQMSPSSYPKAPHGALVKNFPIGIIMTTRGCPYDCVFCSSPDFYD